MSRELSSEVSSPPVWHLIDLAIKSPTDPDSLLFHEEDSRRVLLSYKRRPFLHTVCLIGDSRVHVWIIKENAVQILFRSSFLPIFGKLQTVLQARYNSILFVPALPAQINY